MPSEPAARPWSGADEGLSVNRPRRAHFVRLQQELARKALARGDLDGARSVLRALRPDDFAGATVISETCLRVLRDERERESNVRAAANILGRLPIDGAPPAGRETS